MIKINFKDGKTIDLDLFNQDQVDIYKKQIQNVFFNNRISGMAIYANNQYYVIQKPSKYKTLKWRCGKVAEAIYYGKKILHSKNIGETISLIIDGKIKTSLIYYFSNKMVKNTIQLI